jgi:transcriptional regulator with XRE-family HTH domain
MNVNTFGDWLKAQRRLRKLSQRDVESAAGITHSHMSKMENGHIDLPGDETRARIHAALGTSEDDLVAAGILERIDSPYSDTPVYIAASSIRPVDRAVRDAPGSPESAADDRTRLLTRVEGLRLTTAQITALTTILDGFEAANG